jgi:hypothetical protein
MPLRGFLIIALKGRDMPTMGMAHRKGNNSVTALKGRNTMAGPNGPGRRPSRIGPKKYGIVPQGAKLI